MADEQRPKAGDFIGMPIQEVCDGFVFRSEDDLYPISISDLEPIPKPNNVWQLKVNRSDKFDEELQKLLIARKRK